MNRALSFVVVLVLVGCSNGSPSDTRKELFFEPDGGQLMPDSGSTCDQLADAYCLGDRAHYCRLNAISAQFVGPCSVDADCVLAEALLDESNCLSYGVCDEERPAVLAATASDRKAALIAEMQAFCSSSACNMDGSCASAGAAVARCIAGSCARVAP